MIHGKNEVRAPDSDESTPGNWKDEQGCQKELKSEAIGSTFLVKFDGGLWEECVWRGNLQPGRELHVRWIDLEGFSISGEEAKRQLLIGVGGARFEAFAPIPFQRLDISLNVIDKRVVTRR